MVVKVETGVRNLWSIPGGTLGGLINYESYVNQPFPDGTRKQRYQRKRHPTLKAATVWHRKREVAANDGSLESDREIRARAKTQRERNARECIGASIDTWLERRAAALSNSALNRYELAARQVKALVGERSVAGFGRKDAFTLCVQLAARGGQNGKPLSSRSVTHARSVASQSFDEAVQLGIIDTNPFVGLKISGKKSAERVPPEVDDLRRLLAATDAEQHQDLAIPVLLAIAAGMRMGEVLGLPWSNVDLDAGVLHVKCALDGTNMQIKSTKTESGRRSIALDPDVVAALRAHRLRQKEWALLCGGSYDRKADLVNCSPGGAPWKTGTFSKMYQRFARSLGIRANFHDLRHAHGSQLIAAGVDAKTVSTRLGHSDVRFTLSRYIHSGTEQDRRAANVMGGVLRAPTAKDEAAS
jgi:integrase